MPISPSPTRSCSLPNISAGARARCHTAVLTTIDPDADIVEDVLIGIIDDLPVLANYFADNGELLSATVQCQSITIHTDGIDYINIPLDQVLDCVEDIHVHEWAILRILTQLGIVERLINRLLASQPRQHQRHVL